MLVYKHESYKHPDQNQKEKLISLSIKRTEIRGRYLELTASINPDSSTGFGFCHGLSLRYNPNLPR